MVARAFFSLRALAYSGTLQIYYKGALYYAFY